MKSVSAVVLLAFATVVLGCTQHDEDREPVNYAKPLSESLNAFTVDGTEMDSSTVSSSAQGKMLDCDVPTTEKRLSGDSLSTTYKVITRARESVDSHFLTMDEDRGYSTVSGGTIFKRTYTLNRLSVDSSSALSSGGLAYRDTCTASGCDIKQREYLAGSASYLLDVDTNLKNILHDLDVRGKKSCSFRSVGNPPKDMTAQGSYVLGGIRYKSVRFSSVEEGELYCDGREIGDASNASIYMGKAKRSSTKIVLADSLPQLHNELATYNISTVSADIPGTTAACSRTTVMQNDYVESGGRIYSGSAKEIIQASITGKIATVEEYKKLRQDQVALIQRLRDALTLAQSEKNDADFLVSDSAQKAKEARSKAVSAQTDATNAEGNAAKATATDAEKTAAVLRRSEANAALDNANRLDAVADSKRDLAGLAGKRFLEASTALAKAENDLKN